jgi:DNA-binding HxlR family transcriptional regulator
MPRKKYNLNCPVARTVNVIGDRWAMLLLRDLFLESPRRFQDLERSLGITPAVLSTRLKEFEANGIVESRPYSERPPRSEYILTGKGKALGAVLRAMKEWGEQYT